MKSVVFLELNEINFNYIQAYNRLGYLPNFKKLFADHGFSRTTSEKKYEHLEPWIQWVTAHTGLSFNEHGVFRLGDIVNHDYEQIWEKLEKEKKLKVGAISPFNSKNRTKNAAFFIPDPWTSTDVTGNLLDRALSDAVSQVVNDNADNKITLKSKIALILGVTLNARFSNYFRYFSLAVQSKKKPWSKAMFLDLLLADLYLKKWKKHRPDFSTLFLNAGAHIQHHYMFSSKVYTGKLSNPEWYVNRKHDPVLEVFELYDSIIGEVIRLASKSRLFIATGLTQDPFTLERYYYRLKDHEKFLKHFDLPFITVDPRMSRDFLIHCENENAAKILEQKLKNFIAHDGERIFSTDNRGKSLFVMLVYPKEIAREFSLIYGNEVYKKFYQDVAFVAIKNGAHNGNGFFVDSATVPDNTPVEFPLKNVVSIIESAYD